MTGPVPAGTTAGVLGGDGTLECVVCRAGLVGVGTGVAVACMLVGAGRWLVEGFAEDGAAVVDAATDVGTELLLTTVGGGAVWAVVGAELEQAAVPDTAAQAMNVAARRSAAMRLARMVPPLPDVDCRAASGGTPATGCHATITERLIGLDTAALERIGGCASAGGEHPVVRLIRHCRCMGAVLRCEIFPCDLDATADFYVRVLGFVVDRDERQAQQPYLALVRDDVRIGAAARPDVDHGPRRPPVGVELVIEVDDLDACLDRVTTAGWPVEEALTGRPWGVRDFRVLDPSGYYLRLTEH